MFQSTGNEIIDEGNLRIYEGGPTLSGGAFVGCYRQINCHPGHACTYI